MIHSRQLRRDPSFNTDTNTVRTARTQSSKRDTTPAYSGFQVQEAAKLPAGMTLPCISSLDKIVFIIPQRRFYCNIFLYFFALPRRPERAAAFCPHRLYRGKFFAAASRFCKRPQSCTAAHGCMAPSVFRAFVSAALSRTLPFSLRQRVPLRFFTVRRALCHFLLHHPLKRFTVYLSEAPRRRFAIFPRPAPAEAVRQPKRGTFCAAYILHRAAKNVPKALRDALICDNI